MAIPTPVSFWNADSSLADAIGGNTLTNNGTFTYGTGIINQGFGNPLNGSSQYPSAGNPAGLQITGNLSISAWIKFTAISAAGNYQTVVGKWDSSNARAYRFLLSSNTALFQQGILSGTDANTVSWGITMTTATWYHVVWVYTAAGGTCDFYINGSIQTQKTGLATATSNSTATFAIGATIGTPSEYFANAVIDAVGVWNTTLSSGDVTGLYNSGAGLQYPFISGPANVKTFDGVTQSTGVKTYLGVAVASTKTVDGIA